MVFVISIVSLWVLPYTHEKPISIGWWWLDIMRKEVAEKQFGPKSMWFHYPCSCCYISSLGSVKSPKEAENKGQERQVVRQIKEREKVKASYVQLVLLKEILLIYLLFHQIGPWALGFPYPYPKFVPCYHWFSNVITIVRSFTISPKSITLLFKCILTL